MWIPLNVEVRYNNVIQTNNWALRYFLLPSAVPAELLLSQALSSVWLLLPPWPLLASEHLLQP